MSNSIVETKVTRADVINLILEEMEDEVRAQLTAAEKDLAATPEVVDEDFRCIKIPEDAEIDRCPAYTNGRRDEESIRISYTFTVRKADLPKKILAKLATRDAAEARVTEIEGQLSKLRNNKARVINQVVRQSLEESAEGQKVLSTIGSLKVSLRAKMLGSGK